MRLLDLPPEILDLIIDRTAPDGLENFVLSCRAVYSRAASQIQCHNSLKRTWRHISNLSTTRLRDTLAILHEISREPIIAEYIESLYLWDRGSEDEVMDEDAEYSFRDDDEAMEEIKSLLRRTELYANADESEWWSQILEEDRAHNGSKIDKLYATIALLSLLPNLKVLQLPDRWHETREGEGSEDLVPLVQALVSMSNAPGHRQKPLAQLETLLPFVEEGYDIRVGLQVIEPLMVLKSIRNIYAVSCTAVDEGWGGPGFRWLNPNAKSPLTRVEFASCCMNATGLAGFLSNVPALQVFRYSHQTKWHGVQYDWNPGEVLETLANYCSGTLVDIAITIDELFGEIVNGLSSFLRFTKLERLEVDVECFCGPPLESGQRQGAEARIPEGAVAWRHADIPCMGDMLPDSMRELHVNTNFPQPSEESLLALFKNIVARRQDKLLNLHKTVIRQYRSRSATYIAENHQVVIEVFDADVENPRPRSMMPLWKREFDRRVGGIVSS